MPAAPHPRRAARGVPRDTASRGHRADVAEAFADLPDVPETQRRVLVAAIEAFAARGYHATTTRDLAVGAGLSPAGLYVHFASKQAVLARASLLGHEAAVRLVEQTLAGAGPGPAARVGDLVRTFTAWHARHVLVARVVQYEPGRAGPGRARAGGRAAPPHRAGWSRRRCGAAWPTGRCAPRARTTRPARCCRSASTSRAGTTRPASSRRTTSASATAGWCCACWVRTTRDGGVSDRRRHGGRRAAGRRAAR
nr:TetR/AcrR family transcriptional regulator [Angustibacter aerolatus]